MSEPSAIPALALLAGQSARIEVWQQEKAARSR